MKNYYRILGVSEDAEPEEIKAAYRRLAKKYHPDSNPDDPSIKKKFQEISEAYEALRKEWSRYGHFQSSFHEEPRPKWSFHREIRIPVHLELEETLVEVEKELTYLIRLSHDLGYELLKCKVKIPGGTYQHKKIPLEDVICEGQEAYEKIKEKLENTDVTVIVLLKEKKGFQIRGYHLYSDIYLDYTDLVLGTEIDVDTIEGKYHYVIKPGTRAESNFSLKNKGLIRPYKMGGRGSHYVRVHVKIPTHLTRRQQAALEYFRETLKYDDEEPEDVREAEPGKQAG